MKRQRKLDKLFLFSWKKLGISIVVGFVSIMLHNLIYALFNFEEPLFFIIAVIIVPLYFVILIIYNLINIIKRKRK